MSRSSRFFPAALVAVLALAHVSAAGAGSLPLTGRAAFAAEAEPALCPAGRSEIQLLRNVAARTSPPAAVPWCLPPDAAAVGTDRSWVRLRPAGWPAAIPPTVLPSPRSTRGPPGT